MIWYACFLIIGDRFFPDARWTITSQANCDFLGWSDLGTCSTFLVPHDLLPLARYCLSLKTQCCLFFGQVHCPCMFVVILSLWFTRIPGCYSYVPPVFLWMLLHIFHVRGHIWYIRIINNGIIGFYTIFPCSEVLQVKSKSEFLVL